MCCPVPHSFENGIFSCYNRRYICVKVLSNSEKTKNFPSFLTMFISAYIFVTVSSGIYCVSLLITNRL
jgi:hypothetical protein